jgi:ATP/maltotriose-dependent transcriptional regulator MalT
VSSAVFVGRKDELAGLAAGLDDARAGRPTTFVVSGEAGVGKSRLLSELTRLATEADVRTLTGACMSLTNASAPLLPLVAALREAGDSAALLRALDDGPATGALAAAGALRRYELLDTRLKQLAAEQPLLLVLEDIHWADGSTLEFLTFLLRGLQAQSHRLMVAMSCRTEDAVRRPELREWLAEIGRLPLTRRLELIRFSRRELAAQLAGIIGRPPEPALVERIFARSEGNAFIAEELLAAITEGRGDRLPESLQDALSSRLVDLGADSRTVLQAAATAGRRVEHELLAAVAELGEPALSEALREAVRHQVLVVDGDGYAFRHALLREVIYGELLPGERRRLHAAFAATLERQHGDWPDNAATAAEIAQHWHAAHEPERALAAAVRAGLAAERMYAMSEARMQFERALELWPGVPDAEAIGGLGRRDLLLHTAEAAAAGGFHDRALELVELAGADAATREDAAALMERRASFLRASGRRNEALAAFEEAIRLTPTDPPSAAATRLRAAYGRTLAIVGRHQEACEVAESAAELARRAGMHSDEALALASLGSSLVSLGEHERGLGALRDAERLVQRDGVREIPLVVSTYLADALERSGRFEEAVRTALAARQDAARRGFERTYGILAAYNAAHPLFLLGRCDEADRLLAEALAVGGAPTMAVFAVTLRAQIATMRGDFEAAAELLAEEGPEVAEVTPDAVSQRASCAAELERWQGRHEQARAAVDDGLRSIGEGDDPLYVARLVAVGVRVEAEVAERALARRRTEEAAAAEARADRMLEQVPSTVPVPGTEPAALRATIAAECSRLTGASDVARWEHAVAAHEAWGPMYPLAYQRFRLAEALLAAEGDRERAAQLLREAHATTTALGAVPLRELVAQLGRRARIDLAPAAAAPARAPAQDAPFGLTDRELEVLQHVAAGATNRQIGEALFISAKTAGVHVSNILRKLSAATRAEAATIALRAGVVSGDPPAGQR